MQIRDLPSSTRQQPQPCPCDEGSFHTRPVQPPQILRTYHVPGTTIGTGSTEHTD